MMDLIKYNDSKYDEYEKLLVERDQLIKDSNSIWISYMRIYGELLSELYQEKIDCIKCRKLIGYIQNAINHGQIINMSSVQKQLKQEMALYYQKLNELIEEKNASKEAVTLSSFDVQRAKKIYYRLTKILHPDINPETMKNEKLLELWNRIAQAYQHTDVRELINLEVLVKKSGVENIKIDIPDIDQRLDELRSEIAEIINDKPYIYKELLKDEETITKEKEKLDRELKDYKRYHEELQATIDEMIVNGGTAIRWKMD